MKNSSMQKAAAKTNTNLSRIRKALDDRNTITKVDYADLYVAYFGADGNGEEVLILDVDNGEPLMFSKKAIRQGTIDGNGITMTATDWCEHLVCFFSTKAAML